MTAFRCRKHDVDAVLVQEASRSFFASLHRCLECAREATETYRRITAERVDYSKAPVSEWVTWRSSTG